MAVAIKREMQRKITHLLTQGPESRAMLAKLRRGIGKEPGELPELFEIVFENLPEGFFGKGGEPSREIWAIYTALTLFSLHQQGKDRPMSASGEREGETSGDSLGAAVGRLVRKDMTREKTLKRRFDAVLTADEFTELAHHARGLIQLLKTEDIPLDYPKFAFDLYRYQFDEARNRVRLRWGEDYYRVMHTKMEQKEGVLS
ncbi:MAG TPA: type I-E CRISPR-associated protein Cse2/CasB [Firmicutes bacterium]|nr:type I-E CRISPR-associated protein Cse2/CasB [Bacillota bacterium]